MIIESDKAETKNKSRDRTLKEAFKGTGKISFSENPQFFF